MFYIKGIYKQLIDNEIVFETNNGVGYKGVYIGKSNLTINNEYLFYLESYQNNYSSKTILFDDIRYYEMTSALLKINNIGIKTLSDIFSEFNIEQLETIIKSKNWEKLSSINNISEQTAKQIINEINKKIYKIRLNSKESQMIDALKKLGYKSIAISQILPSIDFKQNIDQIINIALNRISSIDDKS